MKARIYILVVVFAAGAGLLAARAQETKTNVAPVAAESAAPAPSVPAAPKPASANPVPVQPKVNPTPRMSSEPAAASHKEVVTNSSPQVVAAPVPSKPPEEESTNTTPSEPEATATTASTAGEPASENSGLDRKTALLIGAAILAIAGGLAMFMWRRASTSSHGSLISSALTLTKHDEKAVEKDETGTEMTSKAEVEPKKEEKKFPPPMN